MRVFLALELSPEVHARLVDVRRELAQLGAAVRWVRDDNLHVTVKFLGSVSDDALSTLRSSLAPALRDTPRLVAAVRGLGAFPDPRRPRVVWAGVECARLVGVAALVDGPAAHVGVAPQMRPFRSHIALGRVTDPKRVAPLMHALTARADVELGACTFDELVAFRSDLRPGGALYTRLWSIPFGG